MALLTSYTDTNKVVDTQLNVTYQMEMQNMTVTGWHKVGTGAYAYYEYGPYTIPYYNCSRYATKQYNYVGMNEQTALCCQQAKTSKYLRDYTVPYVTETYDQTSGHNITQLSSATVLRPGASVGCHHVEGGMWNVTIQVNEVDTKPSAQKPADIRSLFTAENERDYD